MERLDEAIGPMVEADGQHFNERWGFLSRAGVNDKSQVSPLSPAGRRMGWRTRGMHQGRPHCTCAHQDHGLMAWC
jgi:hypothetical protein